MTLKSRVVLSFLLLVATPANYAGAETLAEMLQRMDLELQEVRTLLGENDIALAAIPKGAVVPFRLVECPRGWKPFGKAAGRTIIGAGEGEGLTERALGERGGEEVHQLTNEELPKLRLAVTDDGTANVPEANRSVIEPGQIVTNGPIEFVGQGNPHNNLQPWIALLYCEKQ